MSQYKQLLNSLNVAIFMVNPATQSIKYANTAAENLVGKSQSHLKESELNDILIHENTWRPLFKEVQNAQSISERSTILLTPYNQEKIEADISISNTIDGNLLLEIQVLNRAHAILRSNELESQAKHNRLIIRNLAHEIRNPLASMKAACQRLYSIEQEKQKTYLDLILSQINRLNDLLKKMTGEDKAIFDKQNIHKLIEESLSLIRHNPDYKNINIKCTYDPSIPDLPLDSGLILQVLNNLLSNAIKASNYAGDILVCTRIEYQRTINQIRHKSLLKLSITDHGCGIPLELQNAIFQPMVTHFEDGSGLGLSIVQNIIQQHQGSIKLSSDFGETTFTIYLPFKRATYE